MANNFFDRARLDFLYEWIAQYRFAQDNGTLSDFWERMITAYLDKFPEDDEPEQDFQRERTNSGRRSLRRPEGIPKPIRERLREWFRNSRRHDRTATSTAAQTSTTVKLFVRASKKLPEWQYYSTMFFRSHIQPTMGTYDEYKASVPEGEKVQAQLAWRMQCIRDSYTAASEDVKEQVRQFKALSESSVEDLSGDSEDVARLVGIVNESTSNSASSSGASTATSHVTATGASGITPSSRKFLQLKRSWGPQCNHFVTPLQL
ncbi:hypothetical protein PENSPDRAFT_694636 [Peniophora sp. CONT]|nr:hypothetical protein PENSPDRAFT_694636 [Peniophora sp. CONT]